MIAHEALEGLQPSEAEAITTPCSRFGQFVYSIGNRPVGECLPRSVQARQTLEAGALASYGPSSIALFRRAGTYIDKILKGEKPARRRRSRSWNVCPAGFVDLDRINNF
jgi:hypothetical protein